MVSDRLSDPHAAVRRDSNGSTSSRDSIVFSLGWSSKSIESVLGSTPAISIGLTRNAFVCQLRNALRTNQTVHVRRQCVVTDFDSFRRVSQRRGGPKTLVANVVAGSGGESSLKFTRCASASTVNLKRRNPGNPRMTS